MMNRSSRHPRRYRDARRLAFTLAEAAVCVAIVGAMLVVALNMVADSARARQVNEYLGKAPALAHDLMSEILQARYQDPEYEGTPVDGAEIELAGHAPASGNSSSFTVRDDDWAAQYFQPAIPAEAQSWSVTRVTIRAKYTGMTNGVGSVQLRTADSSSVPTSTILKKMPLTEATLSATYAWEEFEFANVSGLLPGDGLCLAVVGVTSDTDICVIELEDATGGSGLIETHDAGAPWTVRGGTAMYYHVYGKVTTLVNTTPTMGVDNGEKNSSRVDFDDVDDYGGWSASPPQQKDGSSLSEYAGWTRSVTVEYADPSSVGGTAAGSDLGLKRIKVTVTDPRGAKTVLVGLRGKEGAFEQVPVATKTYVSWVGLEIQLGEADTPLSVGTALVNEPLSGGGGGNLRRKKRSV